MLWLPIQQSLYFAHQMGALTFLTLTFWIVAASSRWNELALCTLFRRGLCEEVQTELACQDDNLSLDMLISVAIAMDNLLQEASSSPLALFLWPS
jgi:hypothetical protein